MTRTSLPLVKESSEYWRGLEERASTEPFANWIQRECPDEESPWSEEPSRRQFLALMGASLALAGVSGCSTRPATRGKIVPHVRAPEEQVPGRPLYYATSMPLGGIGVGLLVESHEGRPTKIEGNPDHPASSSDHRFGPTDLIAQASILSLYDPDRSQTVTFCGQVRTWDAAAAALRQRLQDHKARRGAGLRILSEPVTSPTLGRQMQALLKIYPDARWHQYEPIGRDWSRAGAMLAFGKPLHTYYDLSKADVVLALDADFLTCGPGHTRYVRDFMRRRQVRPGREEMNRLYVVESTPSNTGAKADHRLPIAASRVAEFAKDLAARLGAPGSLPNLSRFEHPWLAPLAADLKPSRSLVLVGEHQPPTVHAIAHAINRHLRNIGETVLLSEPLEIAPVDGVQSLDELTQAIAQGKVETLIIVGGNPVYNAPADLKFAELMQKVSFRLHLSLYQDETSRQSHWHIPEAHYLESWGDTRAYDGTASIIQPLIEPLYGGKSAWELLALLVDQLDRPGYEIVRDTWRARWQGDFERQWQTALHDGVVAGSRPRSLRAAELPLIPLKPEAAASAVEQQNPEEFEIVFRPDPALHDGRFANNGWLQELPRPLTKLCWDNAVILSPATAERLGLDDKLGWHGGEHGWVEAPVVELHYRDRPALLAPVWTLPGHPDNSVTVHLGYGRTHAGHVGNGVGFNAFALRTSGLQGNPTAPWFDSGVRLVPTSQRYKLACTQYHHLIAAEAARQRHVVRAADLETFRKNRLFLSEPDRKQLDEIGKEAKQPLTLYQGIEYRGYKWGMAIDLTACTGCMACVLACQSENNIPVVGKEQVTRGREMHWLRIDRYFEGPTANPRVHFQPIPCMHCENAPCELVCPVEATVHSQDGLNEMVYNRCVGTRYCSNNCPYKVRRFNFLQYSDFATESIKLMHNPDVTVRSRGVMEKCTYCVQRIRHAEIQAKREDRVDPTRPGVAPIFDGEILTACQAACPAEAILFGDLNDPRSKVVQAKADPRNYGLLESLNTRPRTTYLASLRNPNPDSVFASEVR